MMDVTNFAQMLLPFVLLGQGIWFLIDGITEEKKCTQNKAKKDSEEKAYKATIQKSKLDGGDIKAWGSDGKKETVAYTDSKYMKEVKEGDSFNFEITVKNSFKLDKVTDQKASGRCWMFAALNTFRHKFINEFKTEDFEFSQAYTLLM